MRALLRVLAPFVFLSILIFAACGAPSTPAPSKVATAAQKKEPVLYTAKNCFSQMANAASRWQLDAMPVHLESHLNSESPGQNGKATVWQAIFASPGRGAWRSFTCSGSRLNNEPPLGVTGSVESASSPDMSQAMFESLLLDVDSDQAFAIAQENGGAGILRENPQQPVIYTLDWDAKSRKLVWVVMYGSSTADSKGIGIIDATSGKFLRAAR